jgi:hypothetical protein
MNRRTELGLWVALITVSTVAGVAIAGVPDLGAGNEPVVVVGSPDTESAVPADDTVGAPSPMATTTSLAPPAESTTSTTTTTTTTLPEPELRANGEVTVLVVNGTSVVGAAGRLSDRLAADGHPTLTPTSTRSFDVSEVWFTADYGPEAAELAERIGVFPENVRLIPDNAGVSVGSANVIVVIGPDLA